MRPPKVMPWSIKSIFRSNPLVQYPLSGFECRGDTKLIYYVLRSHPIWLAPKIYLLAIPVDTTLRSSIDDHRFTYTYVELARKLLVLPVAYYNAVIDDLSYVKYLREAFRRNHTEILWDEPMVSLGSTVMSTNDRTEL